MASAGNFSFIKHIPFTLTKLFKRTKNKDEKKKIQTHCGCFSAFKRLVGKKKKTSSAESENMPQPCMCEEEVKYTSTICIQEEEKIEALLPCQSEQEIGNDSICVQEEEKIEAPIPCQSEQEICDNSICIQEEEKMEAPIPCQSEQEIGNNSTCIQEEKTETSIPCQAEQVISNDSICIKEEQKCDPSKKVAKKRKKKKKQTKMVEPEKNTQPCSNEEEGNKISTECIIKEETNEVSPSFEAEQNRSDSFTPYTKEEQEAKPDFPSCTNEKNNNEPSTMCLMEENTKKKKKRKKKQTQNTKVETEVKHEASNLRKGEEKKYAWKQRKGEEKKYASTTSTKVQETNQNCPKKQETNQNCPKKQETNQNCPKKQETNQTCPKKQETNQNCPKKQETNQGSTLCQKAEKPRNNNWIPELNLTQQHKMELKSNAWLDDIIIDAAQNLLQKQFGCEGLQSCIFSQLEFSPVYGPSVQIHYDSQRHHWLTSCFKEKQVEIADSIKTRVLPHNIRQQIQYCYRELVRDPASTIKVLDVDQQPNGYDCGVYAIANAYEFLSNGNPICKYNHKEMRSHLIRCLESGEISAFPKRS
uniref:Ubiquitin-like protease family profile domain-containing protein n=1 Tax=Xenopus tropicalis TaxID=8364 RepID=A0A1B8XXA1_XENTR